STHRNTAAARNIPSRHMCRPSTPGHDFYEAWRRVAAVGCDPAWLFWRRALMHTRPVPTIHSFPVSGAERFTRGRVGVRRDTRIQVTMPRWALTAPPFPCRGFLFFCGG